MGPHEFQAQNTELTQDVVLENLILYVASHFRMAEELVRQGDKAAGHKWHQRAVLVGFTFLPRDCPLF